MSSSEKPLDGTPAERLTRHLQSIRDKLHDSEGYLGKANNAFLKNVSWRRLERGYQIFPTNSDKNEIGECFFHIFELIFGVYSFIRS
jgi:hypothetical protein